jgi:hypothetical protein
MFNALDINTKAIIATAKTRQEAVHKAEAKVGREGYCVRPVVEATDNEPFCSVDSGIHPTRLLSGRII